MTDEKRSIFDWLMFLAIHIILIGGIAYAGFLVYGQRLGVWVAASAAVAGLTSTYLYAKIVPGETTMKVILGIIVALNAGYLVHNGAQAMGIEAYNAGQIKKFEVGMAAAASSATRSVARQLGLSARESSALEKAFDDSVSFWAAVLAFLELSTAMVIFSISSRRVKRVEQAAAERRIQTPGFAPASYNFSPATAASPKAQPPQD